MPAFSLIIPVYNTADFLEECIDSILEQSFVDFEIILVNDGSTDNSLEICRKYQDDRILVLDKKNGGLSSARNFGMDHATGDYIWFVDSDDWISEDALEILYGNIVNDPVEIVVFSHYEVRMNSQITPFRVLVQDEGALSGIEYVNKHQYLEPTAWAKAYKRRFLQEARLQFEEGMLYEDIYFNLHAFRHAQKVKRIEGFLYHYRIRNNSIMTSKPGERHIKSQFKLIELLNGLIISGQYNDVYLKWRLKHDMYFLFRLICDSQPSKHQLQSYLKRVEVLGITMQFIDTDSWGDRIINRAFNHKPNIAYSMYVAYRYVKRIGQRVADSRHVLSRIHSRSHSVTS